MFEITCEGARDVTWEASRQQVTVDLGNVELTRLILVSSNAKLRRRLHALHESEFASNVARLVRRQNQ